MPVVESKTQKRSMRRTKIVATLGPATSTLERISELIQAGVNVFRFNFSHGTQDEHAERAALVREAAQRGGRAVAILMDLQGPKMRTGSLTDGQAVELVAGERFTITTRDITGDAQQVSTTYELLPTDVSAGDLVLLSDGLIELHVEHTTDTDVQCEIIHGGRLREHQGINLPGVHISAPAITSKDIADLHFALQHDADYIAISFVRYASDIQRVKELIAQAGKTTPVIAKIERPEAVENLDTILDATDGVMVARGDLGVEMPTERVPIIQKQIIAAANRHGIPVITATQMLESMIQNPRPTRAEASDVANAIIDGTDAVMLSGETATGQYPVDTVQTMALIAETADLSGRRREEGAIRPVLSPTQPLAPLAIGTGASAIVNHLPVKAIVVFTQSGNTARLVAHQRPIVPVLAFTHSVQVYRQLSLLWGITPLLFDYTDSLELFEQQVRTTLVAGGYAEVGDLVVMTGGHPIHRRGQTNFLKVVEIS
jgi:pyruvate kinase